MKFLAILVGKIIYFFLSKINKGTTLTAFIALKIDKNLLDKFKMPKTVIAVTGSSGKGTTSSMITKALRDQNYKVAYNDFGSNLRLGITTMLIINSRLSGEINKDYLVVEIDERYVKQMFPYLKPDYVIITNITRDQPPRNGDYDFVIDEIKKGFDDHHLILNADDPLIQTFKSDKVTYYSINQNNDTIYNQPFENLNIVYCPICFDKLNYNYYHLESYGDYYCNNCDFKKPNSLFSFDYDIDNGIIKHENNNIKLDINILYDAFNTAAAYTLLSLLNIDFDKMLASLNKNHENKNFYKFENRNIYVFSCKNENNTSFNHALKFINRYNESKILIIGWKEISRRYDYDDLSWLYDIDFEMLKKESIEKIICVGINKYDIATRIKLAGFNPTIIVVFDYLEAATKYIKNKTKGSVFGVLNFDYVEPFNHLMKEVDKND